MTKDTFLNSSNAKQMWSFTMKKYFVTPVIVAIYLNNAHKEIVVLNKNINSVSFRARRLSSFSNRNTSWNVA